MWRGGAFVGCLLMGAAALATLKVAQLRDLSELEAVLFQLITLAFGLFGSYLFGKSTAKDAAVEMMKPSARSAFRRLLSLLEGLNALAALLRDDYNDGYSAKERHKVAMALVGEQVRTAYHSLEDWGDLVPDELADLKAKIARVEDDQL